MDFDRRRILGHHIALQHGDLANVYLLITPHDARPTEDIQSDHMASKALSQACDKNQRKIKDFVKTASDTQKVYTARFKFEPVVGETYFLYEGDQENYLSLIAPDQWKKKFLGAYRLSSEYKWEYVKW